MQIAKLLIKKKLQYKRKRCKITLLSYFTAYALEMKGAIYKVCFPVTKQYTISLETKQYNPGTKTDNLIINNN